MNLAQRSKLADENSLRNQARGALVKAILSRLNSADLAEKERRLLMNIARNPKGYVTMSAHVLAMTAADPSNITDAEAEVIVAGALGSVIPIEEVVNNA